MSENEVIRYSHRLMFPFFPRSVLSVIEVILLSPRRLAMHFACRTKHWRSPSQFLLQYPAMLCSMDKCMLFIEVTLIRSSSFTVPHLSALVHRHSEWSRGDSRSPFSYQFISVPVSAMIYSVAYLRSRYMNTSYSTSTAHRFYGVSCRKK